MQILTRLLAMLTLALFIGCSKQHQWLDIKSNKRDAVPSTLEDYQALLDNASFMNQTFPAYPYISSDNLVVPYSSWLSRTATERNLYVWASDIYEGDQAYDWNYTYRMIFHANVVLEGIAKIPQTQQNKIGWNHLKGAAYFFRAQGHYNLLQEFAQSYDHATAAADLGIPIRLTADVNNNPPRSSVEDSYKQVIVDIEAALQLLPLTPQFQTRPSKTAAHALLARVYLLLHDYSKAVKHAGAALDDYNTLTNFNTLNLLAARPFAAFPANPEIIFYAEASLYAVLLQANYMVDSSLYALYTTNDLRRTAFFTIGTGGALSFKGQYTAKNNFFAGIAVNEVYLISAEAKARTGNLAGALADLNTLLSKRWKTGTYTPFNATTQFDALSLILKERRKELPFTAALRWSDLRRLNIDSRFSTTLVRVLNGITFTLPPNHQKYTLPIPDAEIKLSGIQQNPR